MSKQKVKTKRQKSPSEVVKINTELRTISPLTTNQKLAFNAYEDGQNLVLHGYAGTGKTFLSVYLALKELLDGKGPYDRIIILRSVVPSRDVGFLPGTLKEKAEVYERPYKQICNELFEKGDAYDILKNRGVIEFETTSFLRGITFRNSIVIVDEIQNMNSVELHTIMTRMGENSRIVFCGDFRQSDLTRYDEKKGLNDFLTVLSRMNQFDYIEFEQSDIVRSDLVKTFIITQAEIEDENWKKKN